MGLPLNILGLTCPAVPQSIGSPSAPPTPSRPPRTTITRQQANSAVITGQLYIDVQRSRLDTEPDTLPLQSARDCWRAVGTAESGGFYRMWVTIWPVDVNLATSPWFTNPTPIVNADLALIADAFVATWGSHTHDGIYRRGSGTFVP